MPYEWSEENGAVVLSLWPHRSLPKKGFVRIIGLFMAGALVPMVSVLGTAVLWGVLPFFLIVLWALWAAIQRSYRDGELLEVLTLRPKLMRLERHEPGGVLLEWEANPHWVRTQLHRDQKIEAYVTLHGGPREVELGAFLTPEERRAMVQELNLRLSDMKGAD